jgi:hypothetical protein
MKISGILGCLSFALLSACGGGGDAGAPLTPSDGRNGTYQVYATNAQVYALTVNFDARTYTMTGNGLNASGSFSADVSGTTFTIGGNARFRSATDLIVGGFDFGAGVKSFVAARNFVTSASELTHTMNVLGLNHTGVTPTDSRIYQSRFTGGTMQACLDNIIYTVANCPAASVHTYAMSFNGDLITGTDAAHSETITFRVARSGSLLIYLRAGTSSGGSPGFRIGLPEAAGLPGGTFVGASTLGAWGSAALTNTSYNVTATLASGASATDSATLGGLGASGPTGIRAGNRASDGAGVFVMQGSPLAVLVGARGGPAAGYMEIGAQ